MIRILCLRKIVKISRIRRYKENSSMFLKHFRITQYICRMPLLELNTILKDYTILHRALFKYDQQSSRSLIFIITKKTQCLQNAGTNEQRV